LSRLKKVFDESDIQYIIVGGIAVIHYGLVRTTQDVDVIIEDDESKFPRFFKSLRKHDFDFSVEQFQLGYEEKTNISIFDKNSTLRLDLKIAHRTEEIDLLKSAIQDDILGFSLFIAPLEYVLLGKLLYMGNIDDIPDSELYEYQDVSDFLTLFHANKEQINKPFLVKKANEYHLGSTLKRLRSIKL